MLRHLVLKPKQQQWLILMGMGNSTLGKLTKPERSKKFKKIKHYILAILLLTSLILLVIIYQDFKTRSIHWITIPALFTALFLYNADNILIKDILLNILFLLIVFLFMIIYLR